MCLVRLGGGVAMTDPAAARPIREEGVAVARQVGDKSVLSQGLEGLAPLYWLEGNLTAAEAVAAEALLAARAIGSVTQIFLSLLMLVGTACLQHALAKAKAYCDQAADYARETGAVQWNFLVLVGLGLVACFGGQPEQGVRVIVAGETLLRQRGIDFTKTPGRGGPGFGIFAQALERARARLGAAAFEMALAEGQHLTLEQALALAAEIEVVDAPPPEASQAPGAD